MPEVVISNTSPLQYLHQLGHLDLLPHFYQQIQIPPAVIRELETGRQLGVSLPNPTAIDWLYETAPTGNVSLSLATSLGAGEREVFSLALETSNAMVLMDDGRARRIGQRLGIRMTGTVGVLVRATREGMISQLEPMLGQLAQLGFRLSREARVIALGRAGEA